MRKKRCWFGFVKRLFIPEAKPTVDKKTRSCRWFFGRLKMKQRYAALETPERKLDDAKEEQRKHALAVAVATAAAAEAAVAAANAAAEVVRLTSLEYRNRTFAAIKIQSAYRAHLAWKALMGLRGVVMLQALIRGQIVRRKLLTRLKNKQAIKKAQSKVHQIRIPKLEDYSKIGGENKLFSPKKNTETKEVMEKRIDRILEDFIAIKVNKSDQFNQGVAIKGSRMHETEKKNSNMYKKPNETDKNQRLHSDKHCSEDQSLPRRSHCRARRHQCLSADQSEEFSLPNSPVFPPYMALTESYKAKARSLSTRRQRLQFLDNYSVDSSSSNKPKLSSQSSFNGELLSDDFHVLYL